MSPCPYCTQPAPDGAVVCPHCGSNIGPGHKAARIGKALTQIGCGLTILVFVVFPIVLFLLVLVLGLF